MFDRNIHRLFEHMMNDPVAPRPMHPMYRQGLADADGYRVEIKNGEQKEYVLEDGEWRAVGEDGGTDDEVQYEVTAGSDEPTVLTIDAESMVSGDKNVVDATFTNGVLEITFDDGPEEEEE